ncbi:asparagine synthase-related protein [Spirillospora sp. CA-294931]|uniref:asparagine synthase-related protein n=1 Tax=Spirillospora sp. CA-294931 TaxID=3240042 RepID=UPI003D92E8E9
MRAYLAVSTTVPGDEIPHEVWAGLPEAVAAAVPIPAAELRAEQWRSDDGATALLAWTNEPRHARPPRPLIERGGRVLGYCGYLADPDRDERALLETSDPATVAAGLGGCFSIFRADSRGFDATTSITRVCPVYHAEEAGLRFAGSRALLVHLAARAARTGAARPDVDLDVPALQPLLRHGFFTTDETPFAGVRALPNAATLTVRPGEPVGIAEEEFPVPDPAPGGAGATREALSGVAAALLAAVAPLARHDEPVRLALSGGRDSRLMAAVLHAAKVPFHARTHGFADSPDIVLATRVAERLGIEHEVTPAAHGERPASVKAAHPLDRAVHVIRMCEGMTSAYENVDRRQPYTLQPRTSGSGGETLRGGYLYDQDGVTEKAVRRRVRTIFQSAAPFATPAANARASAAWEPWDAAARRDRFGVLDQLYLRYRTGRWIVGSHTATLMNSPYYHPFFDNRVVRETLRFPAEWRRDEELVFGVIGMLAPGLRDIPPEGKRWRFEAQRPRRVSEWGAWRRRAAVVPTGGTSGFNWRKSYDENYLALLREQILDGPSELFEIVDRSRAEEHLSRVPTAWHLQTWHMFTMSVLLSGPWREDQPARPPVRIPVPST